VNPELALPDPLRLAIEVAATAAFALSGIFEGARPEPKTDKPQLDVTIDRARAALTEMLANEGLDVLTFAG
jgi:hypothetical protein